jgi:hypothetical protein
MEITQEYNVDYASQRMVIVKGEIGIYLKEEVGQFSSLLPRTVHWLRSSMSKFQIVIDYVHHACSLLYVVVPKDFLCPVFSIDQMGSFF